MTTVVDLRPPTRYEPTPWCSARVRYENAYGATHWFRERRIAEAEKAGRSPDQCTRRSTHSIDGKPYCSLHAGLVALDILSKQQEKTS